MNMVESAKEYAKEHGYTEESAIEVGEMCDNSQMVQWCLKAIDELNELEITQSNREVDLAAVQAFINILHDIELKLHVNIEVKKIVPDMCIEVLHELIEKKDEEETDE